MCGTRHCKGFLAICHITCPQVHYLVKVCRLQTQCRNSKTVTSSIKFTYLLIITQLDDWEYWLLSHLRWPCHLQHANNPICGSTLASSSCFPHNMINSSIEDSTTRSKHTTLYQLLISNVSWPLAIDSHKWDGVSLQECQPVYQFLMDGQHLHLQNLPQ